MSASPRPELTPGPRLHRPPPRRAPRLAGFRRASTIFGAGFVTGAIALFVALLWTGGLVPPVGPRRAPPVLARPAPSAPGPAAAAASGATTSAILPPAPSRLPGDSTDAPADNLFVPPPNLLASPAPLVSDLEHLRERTLLFPVEGFDLHKLRDNFAEMRGNRVHEAIDIPAPRGTSVLAVDDGQVQKLFVSKQGGLTVYQFDASGRYCYYYAHLDRYAEGLHDGQVLRKGDRVGYVGTSGNAPPNVPHLHFTIFRLGPERHWWEGTAVNPFPLWALAR